MKYKIGDIASQFGISTQTLRNYEQNRLLSPNRRDGSTTREYDSVSVKHIGSLRRYLSYGFSLSEVKEIFSYSDPKQLINAFESRILSAKELMVRQMLLVEAMEMRIDNLHLISELLDSCKIEMCPLSLFLVTRRGKEIVPCDAVKDWTALLPFVWDGRCGRFDANSPIERGYYITESLAEELGISKEPPVITFEETLCCHFVAWEQNYQPVDTMLAPAISHIEKNNMKPVGHWYGRCIMVSEEELGLNRSTPGGLYYELWIPVTNI